jgi:hypothetical protein
MFNRLVAKGLRFNVNTCPNWVVDINAAVNAYIMVGGSDPEKEMKFRRAFKDTVVRHREEFATAADLIEGGRPIKETMDAMLRNIGKEVAESSVRFQRILDGDLTYLDFTPTESELDYHLDPDVDYYARA